MKPGYTHQFVFCAQITSISFSYWKNNDLTQVALFGCWNVASEPQCYWRHVSKLDVCQIKNLAKEDNDQQIQQNDQQMIFWCLIFAVWLFLFVNSLILFWFFRTFVDVLLREVLPHLIFFLLGFFKPHDSLIHHRKNPTFIDNKNNVLPFSELEGKI